MSFHLPLSQRAQVAYSQLLDDAVTASFTRSVQSLDGSFAPKTVHGRRYLYFAVRVDPKTVKQVYVGPDTPEVQRLVERHQARNLELPQQTQALAKACLLHGCQPMERPHLRLMKRLSDAGAFRAGGVVIGTHAFAAYAPMLGVRWTDAGKTSDIDIAHAGQAIALVLPTTEQADLHGALTLDNGFLPSLLDGGQAGVTYRSSADATFQVDFLTPLSRAAAAQPIEVPALNVLAKPLPFLDFLLPGPQAAVVFDTAGLNTLVQVPRPELFAVHKLLVAANRPASQRTKANKDLMQFSALAEVLDATEIRDALQAAAAQGPGWRKRLQTALGRLEPAVQARWAL